MSSSSLIKTGFKVIIVTILLIVLTAKVDLMPGNIRIALSVFGIGSGIFLIFFGKNHLFDSFK